MNKNQNQKFCWNCEASVLVNEEHCHACGVYLSPEENPSLQSVFSSPYRSFQEDSLKEVNDLQVEVLTETSNHESLEIKYTLVSITFLLLGTLFLLFSTLMIIFSQNGTLTLRFDASYWPFYLVTAVPFLFLGWKGLNRL